MGLPSEGAQFYRQRSQQFIESIEIVFYIFVDVGCQKTGHRSCAWISKCDDSKLLILLTFLPYGIIDFSGQILLISEGLCDKKDCGAGFLKPLEYLTL